MEQRTNEMQSVYAIRVIRMILMGIATGKSSYIDRFAYSLYHCDSAWDEMDVSWTAHLCNQLEEIAQEIKSGAHWKRGVFFTILAVEDAKFWDAIGVPMKKARDVEFN